ncbi:hypothetical protein FQR65_LT00092 [Abscondita terminalis]|nr:hypothetical protein FQR65_LT00092 [Abscondita terminalis]
MLPTKYFFLLIASFHFNTTTQSSEIVDYRLPLEVKPFRYWLEIAPYFENDTFSGEIKIEVTAVTNASSITLHNNGLEMPTKEEIKVTEVETMDNLEIESVGFEGTDSQHFFRINLLNPLKAGTNYTIYIPKFTGKFTITALGFYYAVYEDENGNNKTFATTHFQPCNARKAFPCFDEPALKAHFNLRIRRPSDVYHSVSNTPKDEKYVGLLDVFKETNLMSTYLVTFIISEMKFSETLERHRILGIPRDINNNLHEFSLNASYNILNALENFTQIPYAFEKIDHAGIPQDYYYFSAMENWGLITYKNTDLMIPANASTHKKKSVLSIICHELVHQWFGNLVSPEWWEYTWLNEGFANYLQHVIADEIEPSMDIAREMVVNTVQVALSYDGLSVTRPMTSPATDADQIQNLFDLIAYSKSGSVIRMLEHVITPPVFRKGLGYYLNDRKYRSANPSHLYESFQKAVEEESLLQISDSVAEFMTTWETKAGVPLVTVTRIYEKETDNVNLKQRRFLNNQLRGEDGNWKIPINFATGLDPSFEITTPDLWLTGTESFVTVPQLNENVWLIANKLQTGYYRVNYDLTNWNLVINALLTNYREINAINRAQLLDDCAILAKSGDVPQEVNIRLQTYLVNETDPIPLTVQQNTFRSMDSFLSNSNDYEYFQKHVIGILQNTYDRLTFNEKQDETHVEKKLRADVLYWLCKVGHEECRNKCLNAFRAWKENREEIPPDLQSPVFCGAMRNGNEDDFYYLLNCFVETKTAYLEELFGAGLVCVENKTLVEEVLEHTFKKNSGSLIKVLLKAASESSKFGLEAVIDFVPKHYYQVEERHVIAFVKILEKKASRRKCLQITLSNLRVLKNSTNSHMYLKFQKIVNDNKKWKKKNENDLIKALKQYGVKNPKQLNHVFTGDAEDIDKIDIKNLLPRQFENFEGYNLNIGFLDSYPHMFCVRKSISNFIFICQEAVGMEYELLKFVSNKLNFTYTLTPYGNYSTTGNNDVIGYDMIVGGVIVSASMVPFVHFTKTIAFQSYTFLYRPTKMSWLEIFDDIKPFDGVVWIGVIVTLTLIAFGLYVCLKSMVQQVNIINYGNVNPRVTPFLILPLMWFSLTIISTAYKSKLWAISIQSSNIEPSDVKQLLYNGYGFVVNDQSSDVMKDILTNNDRLITSIKQRLVVQKDICSTIDYLLKHKVAMLDQSSVLQYHAFHSCEHLLKKNLFKNLRITKKPLRYGTQVWPLRIGAPYRKSIDNVISMSQIAGLRYKWKADLVQSSDFQYNTIPISQTMTQSSGNQDKILQGFLSSFVLYIFGNTIAILCFAFEIYYNRRKMRV